MAAQHKAAAPPKKAAAPITDQKVDDCDPSQAVPKGYRIKDINNDEIVHYVYNFIDGEYCVPASGEYIDNVNPAKNEVISRISNSNAADIDRAVQAAEAAFPAWSALSVNKRSEYLVKISSAMAKRLDEFALLECRDNGKPKLFASLVDVPAAIGAFKETAEFANYRETSCKVTEDLMQYIQRPPLGVVGGIVPWNYPILLIAGKIAPAIVYGNCCVIKPSEMTPMTAYLLTDLLLEVGLPKGVVNIVHGFGKSAGSPIVEHPKIRAISFTGGSVTGRIVSSLASKTIKKVHLELGGKNPTVICDDADMKEALDGAAKAGFSNTGQICICGSRIFVHKKVAKEFIEKLTAMVQEGFTTKIGDPTKSMYGPLVSQDHRKKVESYIELAKKEGGTILCGGGRPKNLKAPFDKGSWYLPTIIVGLDAMKSRCATEEIFGPVVTIHEWEDDEEVMKQINCVEYGLSASLWTTNLKRAHRMAQKIQSGMVWVNCWAPSGKGTRPFGGFKQSGNGRENGQYSYEFYTECKNIVIKM